MDLVQDIRECFASFDELTARSIETLPAEYPAFALNLSIGYGVGIAAPPDLVVSEKFNGCRYITSLLSVNGQTDNYLMLLSGFPEYRYEFASLCAELLEPGDGGQYRRAILDNPVQWWNRWRGLLGNAAKEQQVYSTIAEMMVLEHKLRYDKTAIWAATISGSHDIECEKESCEVKSTISRYGITVTIAGQHQLDHVKPLFIYFCRMEESIEGISINDMRQRLIDNGYDEGKLDTQLEREGFEKGSSIRSKRFKVLEKRKYEVTDSFPRIVPDSFKNNHIPDQIIQIQYTIDLSGMESTEW